MQETATRDAQVSKLREKLQLISALTGKPENDRLLETSKNGKNLETSFKTRLKWLETDGFKTTKIYMTAEV